MEPMPLADRPEDGVLDDRAVVDGARRGDPAAWRALHGDVAGRLVLWLTTTRGVSAADADDIAAETWLTAARRIHDFHGDRDAFAGWIFGIARKVAANERQKASRRATAPTAEIPETESAPDPSGDVAARDLTRRLLATLPPREAEVVACREVVGLDVAATAQALGISRASVRVAHHRGLGRLRHTLARDGWAEGVATTGDAQPARTGNRTRTVQPRPGSVSSSTRPSWPATRADTIASPSPEPPAAPSPRWRDSSAR